MINRIGSADILTVNARISPNNGYRCTRSGLCTLYTRQQSVLLAGVILNSFRFYKEVNGTKTSRGIAHVFGLLLKISYWFVSRLI